MTVDWGEIEAKWQAKWADAGDYEASPDGRKKKFITVAYPYPNSPQHIGHGRTYTIADVHARFCRMRGYNVLFPMGFHYTGTPILGMAKRVASNDAEILDGLKNVYRVHEDDIKTFVDPVRIADYFSKEIKAGMMEMGYSIDWRREFTTITLGYKKFIEWQVGLLRESGRIIQGSHPVGWCPRDQNPVSQHDTLGDVEPDFTEYIVVKFRMGEYVVPTATLRPETVFGVTNIWVNPDTIYKKATVDGEKWIVSAQCARKLEFLDKVVTYDGDVAGSELVGNDATVPHNGKLVPILGASFVKPGTGTGLVMSVPAHAPLDYQALADLKKAHPENSTITSIEPIPIIAVEGYGRLPARDACEKLGITDQDDQRLEEATAEIYGKEFYGGILNGACSGFAGRSVSEAKDAIAKWLSQGGHSDILLELTNAPVRCRCGTECTVKLLTNQWFLNYGDMQWKQQATKCLDSMGILPQEMAGEFHHVVGWLRERACARQRGLGTTLPWDKDWIVESLSDSVIYMAYYTISRFVNDGTIPVDSLTREFFDYVFLGRGTAGAVPGVDAGAVELARSEFLYFYPVDSRHSGRDLVPNHLTFFVLNHVALFPEIHWPRQMVVNGSVLMDGKKMSKSMGNIIPLRQAIRDHGADPIRLAILVSAELLQDADFGLDSVGGIKAKLEAMIEECRRLERGQEVPEEAEDRWMAERLGALVARTSSSVEKMRLREALHGILFEFEDEIQWYLKRTRAKGRENLAMLHKACSTRVAMLSPFAPHAAEEMWQLLGNSGMVSRSAWPDTSSDMEDADAVQSEHLLKSVIEDIANILRVTKMTPRRVTIYVATASKASAYRSILGLVLAGHTTMGAVMKELSADPATSEMRRDPGFVQKAIRDMLSMPTEIRRARHDAGSFGEAEFLSKELPSLVLQEFGADADVVVVDCPGSRDPKGKAAHARPFKPAILVE